MVQARRDLWSSDGPTTARAAQFLALSGDLRTDDVLKLLDSPSWEHQRSANVVAEYLHDAGGLPAGLHERWSVSSGKSKLAIAATLKMLRQTTPEAEEELHAGLSSQDEDKQLFCLELYWECFSIQRGVTEEDVLGVVDQLLDDGPAPTSPAVVASARHYLAKMGARGEIFVARSLAKKQGGLTRVQTLAAGQSPMPAEVVAEIAKIPDHDDPCLRAQVEKILKRGK